MDPADTKAPPVASFSINHFGARVIVLSNKKNKKNHVLYCGILREPYSELEKNLFCNVVTVLSLRILIFMSKMIKFMKSNQPT